MNTQVEKMPTVEQVGMAVDTLKLLADHTRLQIVWALLHGEHSVGDLASHLDLQPAGVSQHLAKLRLARLVRTRRDGNRIFYSAHNAHVRRLAEEALFHAHHLTDDLPDHKDVAGHATGSVAGRLA
ncbi:MAG: metalloregulator ArsR/SmtB family transcription factor [Actinomycetota bacterium]|nr:metalloregulator ArsR/SmtB family transcription factor [Actinomycetota bacterium]